VKKKITVGAVVVCLLGAIGCKTGKAVFSTKESSVEAVEKGNVMSATIVKTASGLQYIVLTQPAADAVGPQRGSVAQVHYTGWLADADGNPVLTKKFDSSVDRKQPFAFRVGVGMVIAGWDEGVLGMKVGEKRRFIIPANLGYGAQGAGNKIPANATLVFDVELLNVS